MLDKWVVTVTTSVESATGIIPSLVKWLSDSFHVVQWCVINAIAKCIFQLHDLVNLNLVLISFVTFRLQKNNKYYSRFWHTCCSAMAMVLAGRTTFSGKTTFLLTKNACSIPNGLLFNTHMWKPTKPQETTREKVRAGFQLLSQGFLFRPWDRGEGNENLIFYWLLQKSLNSLGTEFLHCSQ